MQIPHDEFKSIKLEEIKELYRETPYMYSEAMEEVAATSDNMTEKNHVLIDVKGMFDRKEAEAMNYLYWRL